MIAPRTIAGLVLAGGRGRRLGGADKAFVDVGGRPMVRYAIDALRAQTGGGVLLSANGDPARFRALGMPVVRDRDVDFAGPLAGVLAGLDWITAQRPDVQALVSVSTDAPLLPADFVARLAAASEGGSRVAIAVSGGRVHPVMALWPRAAAGPIAEALASGERRVMALTEKLGAVQVQFPLIETAAGAVDPFFNVNTPEDLARVRAIISGCAVPVLGVAGFKNSGKTMLVTKLVAALSAQGFKIATLKHTHHAIGDVQALGSDTERHRAAGAVAVALVAPNGWGIVPEFRVTDVTPPLRDVVAALPAADLVIVEGLKRAPIAKIEVRREAAPAEPLQPNDASVMAIAADQAPADIGVPVFALDDVSGIARFIAARFALGGAFLSRG